jgi:bifunctional non-homologous end joining protein LigD
LAFLRLPTIKPDMLKSPFEPCIPSRGTKVPDRPDWLHEIKHDGYRLIIQREGRRVWLWITMR